MTDWQLGIDFGTSYTVAAVGRDGKAEVIDVESDGRSRMASAVFLAEDDTILVGKQAQHQALFKPDRFEPTPKRSIGLGKVFLGDGLIEVSDLVAGVFRRVYVEACRQQGNTTPSVVHITHPADWEDLRLQVLRRAVGAAGIESAAFVAEPIAAAARIAVTATRPSQLIAVYDFGGGTFDAAVLRRTDEGFEVAGPPKGRDPLGGEDIDRRIWDHIGALLGDEHPDEWAMLNSPSEDRWRHFGARLREEVQQAKETLSQSNSCELWIPGIERGAQLTRPELDDLIRGDIDDTVEVLAAAIADAGTTPAELAGIYLVGGSSRIPLVATTIWRQLGVRPATQDNPKSVVALGAAAWPFDRRPTPARDDRDRTWTPDERREERDRTWVAGRGTEVVKARLGVALSGPADRPAPALRSSGSLQVHVPGAEPVTVHCWAAPPGAASKVLAERLGRRYAGSDSAYEELSLGPAAALGQPAGAERRYHASGGHGREERIERYLVCWGYGWAASTLADQAEQLGSLEVLVPTLDARFYFAPAVAVTCPAGSTIIETIEANAPGTFQRLAVTLTTLPYPPPVGQWLERKAQDLMTAHPGATILSRRSGPVIGQIPGEVMRVRVPGQTTMVVAIGVGLIGRSVYDASIWVAEHDRQALGALAYRPALQPEPHS